MPKLTSFFLNLQVLRYVRAIRKGLIKFDDKPKEEPRFYALWDDDSTADRQGLAYIPAPKPKLPGIFLVDMAWDMKRSVILNSLLHDLKFYILS